MTATSSGRRRITVAWCAGLAAAALAGCGGPPPAALEGDVSFAGRPVRAGAIRLFPVGGTAGHGAGAAVTDGRFRIDARRGLVAGTYRVEVVAYESAPVAERPADRSDAGVQVLPPRYNDESELTVTVASGTNRLDLDLSASR